MSDVHAYAVLVLAGIASGIINVLAGGGSFFTLPILIFLGLPATVANATNRVGVVVQNVSGGWAFHRARVLDWRWAAAASVPALVGSALGAWAALYVGDEMFRRVLAVVMVVVTLGTLFASEPKAGSVHRPPGTWWVVLGFLAAGVYGGFLQAGVGFVVLTLTSWAGIDLVRGNAIKMIVVLLTTLLALTIFAARGAVIWPMGLALAVGNAIGATLGARLALRKGHRWIRRVVALMLIAFAVRLWLW